MTEKSIQVGDREVRFKVSGAVPRMYRIMFGADIFVDMDTLQNAYAKNADKQNASQMSVQVLNIFENVAYIMAKHADPSIPDTIDEWLEQFEIFSIYQILPVIFELWMDNMKSISESKKNSPLQSVK